MLQLFCTALCDHERAYEMNELFESIVTTYSFHSFRNILNYEEKVYLRVRAPLSDSDLCQKCSGCPRKTFYHAKHDLYKLVMLMLDFARVLPHFYFYDMNTKSDKSSCLNLKCHLN